ncbi:MAG: DUF1778 domain-containing protein [Planctomycetota bacterium]
MPRSPKKPPTKPKAKAKTPDDAYLRRDFEPKLWKKAQQIAGTYTFISKYDPDEACYFGRTLEMPRVMADGLTPEACLKETLLATALSVAVLLEDDERPPAPLSDQKRTSQLNVRLTADEKLRIEEAARAAGFRGVSDFVRSAALDKAS